MNFPVKKLSVDKHATLVLHDEDKNKDSDRKNSGSLNPTPASPGRVVASPQPPRPSQAVLKPVQKPATLTAQPASVQNPHFAFFVALLLFISYLPFGFVLLLFKLIRIRNHKFRKYEFDIFAVANACLALVAVGGLLWVFVSLNRFPEKGRGRQGAIYFINYFVAVVVLSLFVLNPVAAMLPFFPRNLFATQFMEANLACATSLVTWALFSKSMRHKWVVPVGVVVLKYSFLSQIREMSRRAFEPFYVSRDFYFYIFGVVLSLYYAFDLQFICQRRKLLDPSDYVSALIHLQTDILYRFWKDLAAMLQRPERIKDEAGIIELETAS